MSTTIFVGLLTGMLAFDFFLRAKSMRTRDHSELFALSINGVLIVWGLFIFLNCIRELK